MERTLEQYDAVIAECMALFSKKAHDYGTAWRILRVPSLTDQILIKAQRIRSIQEKGIQLVADGVALAGVQGAPHGLLRTHAAEVNEALLAFLQD